jgi:hypothetical protein
MNNWTPSIDILLDKIRLSCIQLTNRHIKNIYITKGKVLILKSLPLY